MDIKYCYHTHTKRCGHASGEDEEYVINAINNGVKKLGFTDHIFLPHHSQAFIRGDYILLDDYLSSLKQLKEKYKDQIEIFIGFEAENLNQYYSYYEHLLKDKVIDYLILGQHLYINEYGKFRWSFPCVDDEENLRDYTSRLIEGMRSGYFSYVAHPDLFAIGISKWDEISEKYARMILQAAEELQIPLEFNLGGYRHLYNEINHLRYPLEQFWALASQYNIQVVIGSDAHAPEFINKKEEIDYAVSIINKYHLNLLKEIEFVKL